MIKVGDFTFHKRIICFHFTRESIFLPWETIGVYLSCYGYVNCKYEKQFKSIMTAYKKEVKKTGSPTIAASDEFLEKWRMNFQEPLSVICPIINYYTTYADPVHQIDILYKKYVGNTSANAFARLGLMLRNKAAHFPIVNNRTRDWRKAKKQLSEAGLI